MSWVRWFQAEQQRGCQAKRVTRHRELEVDGVKAGQKRLPAVRRVGFFQEPRGKRKGLEQGVLPCQPLLKRPHRPQSKVHLSGDTVADSQRQEIHLRSRHSLGTRWSTCDMFSSCSRFQNNPVKHSTKGSFSSFEEVRNVQNTRGG